MPSESNNLPKLHKRYSRKILVSLLVINSSLLAWGAWSHSPTTDEIAYLPAGLWHWTTGRFDLACVSPPLVRMVAAVPLLIVPSKTDWSAVDVVPGHRSEHAVGRAFLRANGFQSFWDFTLARLACIPFSWLGLYICWRWAGELYGGAAGAIAACMWCFSPNLLAHGQLVTPDVGLTATVVAATYVFWRWLNCRDWILSVLAGISLGVAELAKTTSIVLFAVYPIIWFLDTHLRRDRPTRTELLQFVSIVAIAIFAINAGYGYSGTGRSLRDYEFCSQALSGSEVAGDVGNRFRDGWLGQLPVPFPADYVTGIDLQRRDFDVKSRSYLRGEFQDGGWWYYYLYGMAVKVPIGTGLLVLLAIITRLRAPVDPQLRRSDVALLVPPLVLLVFVSSQTAFSSHFRYVLAILPFVFIWASQAARSFRAPASILARLVVIAAVWSWTSSLYVYPHSLSYFNEFVGGPRGGHAHLINSNIDWAQDLLYLQKWLNRNPQAKHLGLAFYGGYDPGLAGIEFELPPSSDMGSVSIPPGWYAVSVNFLRGHHFPVVNGSGESESSSPARWTYFLTHEPVAMCGYSIYIYHVVPEERATKESRSQRASFGKMAALSFLWHP